MTTITLGGTTVVQPTSMQPYVPARVSAHEPIDGEVIVQISNHQDSYGDKNTPRRMAWEALPTTSTDWDHTVGTLKALEGSNTTITADSAFGGAYSSSTNIKVHLVDVKWVGRNASTDWWQVEIEYSHR